VRTETPKLAKVEAPSQIYLRGWAWL